MPALTPENYVTALYRHLLGREPDAGGLSHWVSEMQRTGDATLVLDAFLGSPEYDARRGRAAAHHAGAIAAEARLRLARDPLVVDVGAQLLGPGTHAYDPLRAHTRLSVIGFDPLEQRIQERADAERGMDVRLLPYAIGDGGEHVLHVNDPDATSSLFPLNAAQNAEFGPLRDLKTVGHQRVRTHRLDDVLPPAPVDFLKLDVQGGELMVLQSAQQVLARTAVVHCEVEFSPIYERQPLYPEVHEFLAARGFVLIDLLTPCRYASTNSLGIESSDRLLWAEAVFFRAEGSPEMLSAQALIAAGVYAKASLAQRLLDRAGEASSRA